MNLPRISLIIPVHNGERYLGAALDSVALQDYPNLEVILLDDGSTDASLDIARKSPLPMRLVTESHRGVYPVRNAGIRMAQGDYLCFFDADDLLTPGILAKLAGFMVEHPEVDLVKGLLRRFAENEGKWLPLDDPHDEPFSLCAMLFRPSVFERVGLFAEDMKLGADADWHLRAAHLGIKPTVLKIHSLWYRMHDQSISKRIEEAKSARLEILRRKLSRERQTRTGLPPN